MAFSPGLLRLTRGRPRLLISTLLGGLAYALLPDHLRQPLRGIAAWDVGVCCYLVLAFHMFAVSGPDEIRQRAEAHDENAWIILLLTSAAALASLLVIVLALRGAKDLEPSILALNLGLAGGTIICSWALVHVMFAQHYAHGYYQREGEAKTKATPKSTPKALPSLRFPGDEPPDYWDFCYFSFVIGMTCQVSDVDVANRGLRRLALAQGVLAFFFNTIILALSVNIAAGLL